MDKEAQAMARDLDREARNTFEDQGHAWVVTLSDPAV